MKIWIVCVGEPLPTDGENTRLRRMGNLAKCISENGHTVEWFSASFNHYKKSQRFNENMDIKIDENYVMHIVYTNGYENNISFSRILHHKSAGKNIYKKMKELDKPDIIIASMEPLEVASAVTKYGTENSIPVIVDVRDLWPEIYFEVLPRNLHFALKPYVSFCRSVLKNIMSNAYSIVGLSEGFLDYGLKFANRERRETDKVFPIAYPNYNYEMYKGTFEENWEGYGISKDDFIVVFFGNFGKQFDFESIIEASNILKYNSKIKFVLCGTGLQFEKVKSRVSKNVIFPGWIEKNQILSLASNASIGLAPYINSINYTNNTPNKFGEYLSAGLPILVSVNGEMESLLRENECGYHYKTGKDLAEKIEFYFEEKIKLREHSKRARQLYERQYNGDVAYKNILDHLIEVSKKYNIEREI